MDTRIIEVKFESHWSDNVERWTTLNHLMNADWKREMERQLNRNFWSKVASKIPSFPQDPHVWHMHPLGWVDNFSADACQPMAWGKKVSVAFKRRVVEICKELEIHPDWLMSCMAFETGETFSPSRRNAAGSGATGLIQFMPKTAKLMFNTTAEYLASLTDVVQLDYVLKFFKDSKKNPRTLEDTYLVILWPSAIRKDDSHVIWTRYKKDAKGIQALNEDGTPKEDIYYLQNRGLDKNKDGLVTRSEVVATIHRVLEKGLGDEFFG